jgi:hypothetical protein
MDQGSYKVRSSPPSSPPQSPSFRRNRRAAIDYKNTARLNRLRITERRRRPTHGPGREPRDGGGAAAPDIKAAADARAKSGRRRKAPAAHSADPQPIDRNFFRDNPTFRHPTQQIPNSPSGARTGPSARRALERRVAVLEGGRLEEFSIERESDRQISGSIYKGKVKNLEPGLKAMFVDIGLDKNAFLHYWDAIPAALDAASRASSAAASKRKNQKRITANDIPGIYPPGSDIIVQVTKGPIGTKGPRITTNISLAGRYLVLMPYSDQSGISRKIEDPKERQRLRRILKELDRARGHGRHHPHRGRRPEGALLRARPARAARAMEAHPAISKPPARRSCCLAEPDLIERTVRDFLTDEVDRIVVDDSTRPTG